ncbi:MAG TPA: hypothetical protein VF170_13805 [Planctomycetaceae bacterium]
MTLRTHFRELGLAAAALAALAGCDVDVKDPGKLPSADVDVAPGEAPDVDVRGPEVDVTTEEKKVDVPDVDVDVDTKEETVTVPDVNVDVPEENENE